MSKLKRKKFEYIIDEKIKEIVKKVIAKDQYKRYDLDYIDVDKMFFVHEKGSRRKRYYKDVFAFIQKIKEPYRTLTGKIYLLIVTDRFYELDDNLKELVILHELLHVHSDFDGKLVPHDVEDFKEIIDDYGIDWLVD